MTSPTRLPVAATGRRLLDQLAGEPAILAEAEGDEFATTALLHAGSALRLIIDERSGAVAGAYRDAVAARAHLALEAARILRVRR
jgi:hypothetical protein